MAVPELLRRLHRADAALSARLALTGPTPGAPETAPHPFLVPLARAGAHLGDGWLWLLVGGWLWRRIQQHPPPEQALARRPFQGWIASTLLTFLLVMVVKQGVRRPRPGTARFMYGYGPDVHSFPSGHGARMGANGPWATLLLGPWGWLTWPLALWVGWSRVAVGIHYLGDVLAGFLLGSLVSLAVRGRLRRTARRA